MAVPLEHFATINDLCNNQLTLGMPFIYLLSLLVFLTSLTTTYLLEVAVPLEHLATINCLPNNQPTLGMPSCLSTL